MHSPSTDGPIQPHGVGAIRLIRTFRIDQTGRLFPIYRDTPWDAGTNEATCARGRNHQPPAAACRCGLYGYAHPDWAREQAPSRDVLAVIAAWGTLEVGTRGARSSHARVEALWLADTVTNQLAVAIADHYPGVPIYRDRAALITEHPLTRLPGFHKPLVSGASRATLTRALWTLAAVAVCVGAPPALLITTMPILAALWLTALAGSVLTVVAGVLTRSSSVVAAGSSVGAWTLSSAAPLPALIVGRFMLLAVVMLFVATWRETRIIGADLPLRHGPQAMLRRASRYLRTRR